MGMATEQKSFVFYGGDEGAVAEAAAEKYAELSGSGDDWGNEIIDGTASVVDEAVQILRRTCDSLQMFNMFGGRKVVWLKNVTFMGDTPGGARSEAVQKGMEELISTLQNLPDDTFFILHTSEPDKRRSFFRKLCTLAVVREFPGIDISREGWESEVAALVLKLAQPTGLRFDNDALELFVQRVNEGSRQISCELTKLDIYLGAERRLVTERDVELMIPVSRRGVIFEISRAIERSDSRRAIRLLNEQLAAGEQGVTIIRAAIIPVVRRRFCTCLLVNEFGLSPQRGYKSFERALNELPEDARKLIPRKKDGTLSCYGIYSTACSLGKLTLEKARSHLAACAKADRQLVSSLTDVRDVLHTLVLTLTA